MRSVGVRLRVLLGLRRGLERVDILFELEFARLVENPLVVLRFLEWHLVFALFLLHIVVWCLEGVLRVDVERLLELLLRLLFLS